MRRVFNRLGYRLVRDNGREATIFPDDRLIVSFPRSGNTWLSFLVTTLLNPADPTSFSTLENRCPDIYAHTDADLRAVPRPRLLKSHEPFDPRYPTVVYLVRHPFDVAVSYHRFLVKTRHIDEAFPLEQFVDRFLKGSWGATYGSWAEHVGSWRGARPGTASFLLVRYEDLHAEPVAVLHSIAGFLGIDAAADDCARAVELCSPERMRKLERAQAEEVPGLKGSRLHVPFVGPAAVGGGAAALTHEQQRRIQAAWGGLMDELGYDGPPALTTAVGGASVH